MEEEPGHGGEEWGHQGGGEEQLGQLAKGEYQQEGEEYCRGEYDVDIEEMEFGSLQWEETKEGDGGGDAEGWKEEANRGAHEEDSSRRMEEARGFRGREQVERTG